MQYSSDDICNPESLNGGINSRDSKHSKPKSVISAIIGALIAGLVAIAMFIFYSPGIIIPQLLVFLMSAGFLPLAIATVLSISAITFVAIFMVYEFIDFVFNGRLLPSVISEASPAAPPPPAELPKFGGRIRASSVPSKLPPPVSVVISTQQNLQPKPLAGEISEKMSSLRHVEPPANTKKSKQMSEEETIGILSPAFEKMRAHIDPSSSQLKPSGDNNWGNSSGAAPTLSDLPKSIQQPKPVSEISTSSINPSSASPSRAAVGALPAAAQVTKTSQNTNDISVASSSHIEPDQTAIPEIQNSTPTLTPTDQRRNSNPTSEREKCEGTVHLVGNPEVKISRHLPSTPSQNTNNASVSSPSAHTKPKQMPAPETQKTLTQTRPRRNSNSMVLGAAEKDTFEGRMNFFKNLLEKNNTDTKPRFDGFIAPQRKR